MEGKTCLYLSWVCLYKYALSNSIVLLLPADFFSLLIVFSVSLRTCGFLSGQSVSRGIQRIDKNTYYYI